jgi:hypothetical protein
VFFDLEHPFLQVQREQERGLRSEEHSCPVILIVGAIAGWLAGQVMKGGGYGLLGDIIVGLIGALIGGIIFSAL